MRYIFKEDDAFEFERSFGYEYRKRNGELEFKRCPYCNGGDHSDFWTFSVNLSSGAFKCLRASCNQSGHFAELCRDFDYQLITEQPKIYRRLPQSKPNSAEAAINYLKKRGIRESITRRFNVTCRKDNGNVLVFPFYDADGNLTFVKYRNTAARKGESKEWCEKNTMPILFGMNHCNGFDRLIITEGQIDCLSVIEAGFDNVVSVPTGALGFSWLTPCWSWITKFKEIVVFGDCEHGKITLLDTLQARLPNEIIIKVVRVQDYLGEKDANDILCTYGANAVKRCVDGAEIPKLSNVKQLADVQAVDIFKIDRIQTGIKELDRVILGMAMGQLIILTGKRGEGKSTFMSQIICNALDQGRTVFAYSGELADFHFKRWLDFQLAGISNITQSKNRFGDPEYSISGNVLDRINAWYRNRAFVYDNAILDGSESLTDTVEKVITRHNAQLVCIDNLMTAMDRVTEQKNLYLAQSNFVGKLKALAVKYSVVILLIAHPRKGDGDDENDLISGSSDITNKADIVLKYQRCDEPDADGIIKVTKNRLTGKLRLRKEDAIRVRYSPMSKRITDAGNVFDMPYGWEASGIQSPDNDLPF